MAELIQSFTILSQTEPDKSFEDLLVNGETLLACYKTIRDYALLTDQRFVFQDSQGVTGTKKVTFSLLFKSILCFSTENPGILNADGQIIFYTAIGTITLKVSRACNISELTTLLNQAIIK